MTAKKLLILVLTESLLISACSCSAKESSTIPATVETTVETTPKSSSEYTRSSLPDYIPELREHLGVDPVSSSFEEVLYMAQTMKYDRGSYTEDEKHHFCQIVYNGEIYYIIRYEKAYEWFEYYFCGDDYLSFESDNGVVMICDESYTGPEGMLLTYYFIAFVDNSGKFLIIAENATQWPSVSESDIDAFKGFYDEPDGDVI